MINYINLISQLNKRENYLEISNVNNTILTILENLESKGFLNFIYNPYTNKIIIFNNNIKLITLKSKPSRNVFINNFFNKTPYKLSLGNFICKPTNINKNKSFQLLLYVE